MIVIEMTCAKCKRPFMVINPKVYNHKCPTCGTINPPDAKETTTP